MVGRSGRRRMHEPSLSHRRPRLGCLAGTFSPSHRQIRSTRFLFTVQPALRSNAVIRRYPYPPTASRCLHRIAHHIHQRPEQLVVIAAGSCPSR